MCGNDITSAAPKHYQPDVFELRISNRIRSRLEFAGGATKLTARPRFLFVELTRKCNLSCDMCRPADYNRSAQSMSSDLFQRIQTDLFPYADIVDLRGWGESLILPEFEDRLARTLSTGAEIRIITNLSFHRPTALETLATAGAYIGVSIDSADYDTLRTIRGGARLDLIERNLNNLSVQMKSAGHEDRLCIYVTCHALNLDKLAEIIGLAARCGVRDVRFAPITISSKSPLAITEDCSVLKAVFSKVEVYAKKHKIKASLTASLIDFPEPRKATTACLHPWTHCYITNDGRLGFCDHLIGPEGDPYIMGDLNENTFEEIWNGPTWIALRKEHLGRRDPNAQHFKECAWCYRNRFLDSEDLLDPTMGSERVDISDIPWP